MKKLLLLLTVLVLALSVTACNKTTGNDNDSSKDNNKRAESTTQENDNDKNENNTNETTTEAATEVTTTTTPTEEPTTAQPSYAATEEILNAAKYDQIVQIGNTVLHHPFTIQDVLDAGATIKGSNYNPDYLVPAANGEFITFTLGDGSFNIYFANMTETMCSLKDTVSFWQFYECTSSSVFFPGGLHAGISLSDLQTIFGTADEEKIGTLNDYITYRYLESPAKYMGGDMYSETNNSYSVSVDRNTGKVTHIYRSFPY